MQVNGLDFGINKVAHRPSPSPPSERKVLGVVVKRQTHIQIVVKNDVLLPTLSIIKYFLRSGLLCCGPVAPGPVLAEIPPSPGSALCSGVFVTRDNKILFCLGQNLF